MAKKPSKPSLKTKSGKFWLELNKGKSRKEAAKIAGINPKNSGAVMRTENFQALERSSYKEEILKHITMAQVAQEQIKVIQQDKDLGAKNTAIKMFLEKVEPEGTVGEEKEKIQIILK